MGICKFKAGDDAGHTDLLAFFISGGPVVGESRIGRNCQSERHCKYCDPFAFHMVPLRRRPRDTFAPTVIRAYSEYPWSAVSVSTASQFSPKSSKSDVKFAQKLTHPSTLSPRICSPYQPP